MGLPKKIEILKLYKDLLRYGQELKFTDKEYFQKRIKKEFKQNKVVTDETDINFKFEKGIILLLRKTVIYYKKYIDYSKVPVLKESDLYEQFVKGSGPGGSKINTTSSCVVLKHIPTGLIVKCQKTRFLNQNQSIARELLLTKLDNLLNGNDSVESQKKRLAEKRSLTCRLKKEKLKQMKETWKERESVT
ncbi:hypothetical protein GWI33_006046 [Rhynchophorus ferrugineus]|uniref:Prokaryotic-type class I peptide chain release factors domain-containing protein n=1 Tax=Rhynchophorus ferrugineus TaxID=354439 RepID=A0A834J2I0_RHYFE|nr:hypothetical protein GWI33_006046 [Rhynchophorus ferrugineus]